jgi:diphthine-ammonia ligase
MSPHALVSWSGGKDSFFAALKAKEEGYALKVLLNVLNEEGQISRSHGIPASILQAQAQSLNLPIHLVASSWNDYEPKFTAALESLGKEYHLSHAVFGDIDLEDHRQWEEKVCTNAGLSAVLPLWQKNRKDLVFHMLASGLKTIIVSCNETMGARFIGVLLTPAVIEELESLGIDPCGETGEYHTLVIDGPSFTFPLEVEIRQKLQHQNFWFADLALVNQKQQGRPRENSL